MRSRYGRDQVRSGVSPVHRGDPRIAGAATSSPIRPEGIRATRLPGRFGAIRRTDSVGSKVIWPSFKWTSVGRAGPHLAPRRPVYRFSQVELTPEPLTNSALES